MKIALLAVLLADVAVASCFVKLPTQNEHWVNADLVTEVKRERTLMRIHLNSPMTHSVELNGIEFGTVQRADSAVQQLVSQLNQCRANK